MYGLKDNVARKAGTMGKEENRRKWMFWTQEEFQAFIGVVWQISLFRIMHLKYFIGLVFVKVSCLHLTPGDFNFEKKTLRINKSYQRLEGKDVITDPKTPKSNQNHCHAGFPYYRDGGFYKKHYMESEMDDRIFTISKSYLHHEMDRGAKLAGVKRIRDPWIHDIRIFPC